MEEEIWKDIPGYEGLYMVSSKGRVKSLNYRNTGKTRIKKNQRYPNGYETVNLSKDGIIKAHLVHRLVAESFIPNPNNLPQVNHRNEVVIDNRVENLEWCDAKYNANYGTRNTRASDKKYISVLQYTLDGEFIKEWKGLMVVEKELGFARSNIWQCCNGKANSAYGFKWAYKNN